ncbi:MAG: hypothetical protein WC700_08990 [Gemmatimonadaceae bacterium]|jgi:hypothetical protein
MADDVVRTEFVADDKITGPMGRIQARAAGLAKQFEQMSSKVVGLAGLGGMLAGAFSFGKMMADANAYLGQIRSLQKVTGMTAEKTSGLMGAMSAVGIESDIATMMITRMAGKETQLGQMAENAKGLAGQMQKIGAATHDPIVNLKAMAEAYKAHNAKMDLTVGKKLIKTTEFDIVTMAKMAGLPVKMAQKLEPLLKGGAKGIDELFKKAERMGLVVTQKQLDGLARLGKAKTEIKNTMLGLAVTIMDKVQPALSSVMEQGRDWLVAWIDKAERFIQLLGDGLDQAVQKIKTLVSIVAVSGILTKMTGKGLIGTIGAGASSGSSAGAATGMAGGAAAGGFAALAAWAVIIYSIVGAFTSIWNNTLGVVDILKTAWSELNTALAPIWAAIGQLLSPFEGIINTIRDFLADFFKGVSMADAFAAVIPMTVGMLIEGATQIVLLFRSVWTWISENFKSWANEVHTLFAKIVNGIIELINKIPLISKIEGRMSVPDAVAGGRSLGDVWDQVTKDNETLAAAARVAESMAKYTKWQGEAEKGRKEAARLKAIEDAKKKQQGAAGGKNYDFRGSHFTITQQFAEGFDPDRIAVSFAGGVTALSDRRTEAQGAM